MHIKQIFALAAVLAISISCQASNILIDNFESYSIGAPINGLGSWSSTGSSSPVIALAPNNPGNKVLKCTGDSINAFCQSSVLTWVDETQTKLLVFDIYCEGTTSQGFNISVGSSPLTAPGAYTDYQAQFRLLTEFLSTTIDHLAVRNGSAFVTVADTARNNWYKITMELRNPANQYDFYVNDGTFVSYKNSLYRNTSDGTKSFFIKSASSTTANLYIDNIYLMDPEPPCPSIPADGDVDGNRYVDLRDFALLAEIWLECYDMNDLLIVTNHWLELHHSAPSVFVGSDKNILVPEGNTSIHETLALSDSQVSDDGYPMPSRLTQVWSYQSGPGSVTFEPNEYVLHPNATVDGPLGDYVLRLTADDGDKTAYDELTIRVSDSTYVPPASPHVTFNFNPAWRFIKQDVPGAQVPTYNDSSWDVVSTPHTYNDVDTYDELISHSGGEKSEYMGVAWYRKHFNLPASAEGNKVFLEFEGLKQAGRFWVNGEFVGKYENGVTPCGLDLTDFVNFGDEENVIAVKVDNSNNYTEESTGVAFEWMGRAFNPNYGGLNHNVWLHLAGKVYQTLPLYENLKTTGIYIYPSNFSISNKTCDVTIESQVRNESGDQQSITLSAVIVDAEGLVRATLRGDTSDLVTGETKILKASGQLTSARFWDVNDPYLYDVYSILTVNGKVVDVCKIRTGFRKTEFKGGAGTGGVWLNGRFVYLTGYAQRATNDWAGLGQAYPDWMHNFNAKLVRGSHANYIRWMHIAPQRVDVSACDKYGIVEICPAGDKEKDVEGRQWEQRVEVMRDTIIYYRNVPSILFWEAGNTVITPSHMQQMVDLRKQWDPNGGRVMGTRGNSDNTANTALTPIAEYYGVMIGQDPRTDALVGYTDMFRAYSAERRDRAPLIETEDFRDEAARRFWDDYSPPHFGFKQGPNDTYHWNSETFCIAAIGRYHDYFINCISNSDPAHSKWSGYASIYWSDSNADGRQESSEVCRVSGKVDSVRLPKEAYSVHGVMQSEQPDIHIIGHWTYPATQPDGLPTVKNVYVISNCEQVELFVNGTSKDYGTKSNRYLFTWNSVAWAPGTIRAIGYNSGIEAVRQEKTTVGTPHHIQMTAITAAGGLRADGSDIALIDVEVVDAQGNRCPTDEGRIDFTISGPGIWRGGYNSGIEHTTNNLYLNTECGINRVAVRSTLTSGTITVTASRSGLPLATLDIPAHPISLVDGLTTEMPVSDDSL